jgi:hypothetical protein
MKINIPISVGELLDKITILKIKSIKIKEENKLLNIKKELEELEKASLENKLQGKSLYKPYIYQLYEVNNCLWNIENQIRELEEKKQFDDFFIETARKVYEFNDRRAKIKKEINLYYSSDLIEEKSYK